MIWMLIPTARWPVRRRKTKATGSAVRIRDRLEIFMGYNENNSLFNLCSSILKKLLRLFLFTKLSPE